VDGILVSQPVAALDGVVCVPPPIVVVHIAEGSVDAALSCNCVRPGGEQLRDAGGLESLLDESEGSPEAGSSSPDYDCVEGVVDDGVLLEEGVLASGACTSASLE